MWLFRVAELFSYNFQTILHFADVNSLLGTLLAIQLGSLMERAILNKATLWEEYSVPLDAFCTMKTLSVLKHWPIEGFRYVIAFTLTLM